MRTKQALILEKVLHNLKHRYLLCWNGEAEDSAYDCACCMTYFGSEDTRNCRCICHKRIDEMASSPLLTLWLLGLESNDILPFIPKDFNDWFQHALANKKAHDQMREEHPRITWDCTCEDCEFIRKMSKQNATDPVDCECHVCKAFEQFDPAPTQTTLAEIEEQWRQNPPAPLQPLDPEVEMYTSPVPSEPATVPVVTSPVMWSTETAGYKLGDLVWQNGTPIGICIASGTVVTNSQDFNDAVGFQGYLDSLKERGVAGLELPQNQAERDRMFALWKLYGRPKNISEYLEKQADVVANFNQYELVDEDEEDPCDGCDASCEDDCDGCEYYRDVTAEQVQNAMFPPEDEV